MIPQFFQIEKVSVMLNIWLDTQDTNLLYTFSSIWRNQYIDLNIRSAI